MLFNSYAFIFYFLPITVAGFFLAGRLVHHKAALCWLTGASLFFYGWWNPAYLWLLGASILFNFLVGRRLILAQSGTMTRRLVLALGIGADLAALSYFKYANFFLDNLRLVTGFPAGFAHIVLPLGISFFTFTQIAFLVDSYRRLATEPSFLKYALFVTYFPHLIAGPIIHHKDVMGQMSNARTSVWSNTRLAVGLTIFIIGLFKKMVIADTLAQYPDLIFGLAARGARPDMVMSWAAALGYTLQIYFDFSGYSDMAIGLSRIFGIQLPINFNSPYKAQNIVEFWRRWHISLSRFLRDYLYYPLGGNRRGPARRYLNLMTTMLLGGLWHGAGWTFLIWGGLHGLYLIVNHAWQAVRLRWRRPPTAAERSLGMALTFLAVTTAWVFFRADNMVAVSAMLRGMTGHNNIIIPDWIRLALGWKPNISTMFLPRRRDYLALACALVIAWGFPNTTQLMSRFRPGISLYEPPQSSRLQWRITPAFACLAALLLFFSLAFLGRPSEFIYFNF
jgi:alginate O-acetyltransferase complex protein AlgI